jgi:plasmid stabilization system protein ParE
MESPGYELSSAARLDLLQTWNYLADHASVEVADRVLRRIEIGIRRIAKSPNLGHLRPDLTSHELRFYLIRPHLIIYRPKTVPLQIARVLHAARDARSILDP